MQRLCEQYQTKYRNKNYVRAGLIYMPRPTQTEVGRTTDSEHCDPHAYRFIVLYVPISAPVGPSTLPKQ